MQKYKSHKIFRSLATEYFNRSFPKDQFSKNIKNMCKQFDIQCPDLSLVELLRKIWTSRQLPLNA